MYFSVSAALQIWIGSTFSQAKNIISKDQGKVTGKGKGF